MENKEFNDWKLLFFGPWSVFPSTRSYILIEFGQKRQGLWFISYDLFPNFLFSPFLCSQSITSLSLDKEQGVDVRLTSWSLHLHYLQSLIETEWKVHVGSQSRPECRKGIRVRLSSLTTPHRLVCRTLSDLQWTLSYTTLPIVLQKSTPILIESILWPSLFPVPLRLPWTYLGKI